MHLTWTPPTAGVQGGYCPEDEIDYWIYRVVEDDLIGGADYQYEGHTKELEFSVRLPEGSPQEAVYYTVLARSAAGEIDGLYCIDLLGEPKKLPYEVNLLKAKDDNAGLLLSELAIYDGMDWNVSSWESACDVLKSVWPDLANVTDKGGYAFFCLGEADDLAAMSAKKFSTLGTEEASVKFTAYTGEGSPTIMILGETYGLEERVLLGYMEGGEEPVTTETFALPKELQNKNWVCVYALALFQRPGELFTFLGFEASAKGGDSSVQAKSIKDSFILGGKGNIQFLGFENADAVIARMDGAVVARPHLGSGDVKVAVEPGIYVVKAGGKSRKVVVK